MTKTPAQLAYEEDIRRQPLYHDGTERKTWGALGEVEQWTWKRNPTPRDYAAARSIALRPFGVAYDEPVKGENAMHKYRFIVRHAPGDGTQPVLAEGETKASRAAVAVKSAAESIKNRPPKGQWFHVSIQRIE